jgi:hypothetical protein
MLIREMTISDADFIWRHPHLHTSQEVALASTILNLADEFHLDDESETFDDVKAERDALQKNYDYVCQQVDKMDEIIATQHDRIQALADYIDELTAKGTADEFMKQHRLWRD